MDLINYTTNLDTSNFSGGWSGMNHFVHSELKKKFTINCIEKIEPRYFLSDRLFSKAFRFIGLKGNYPAFTNRRLNKIKSLVEPKLNKDAFLNFFHGATPWLNIKSNVPYALYLDACFASYIRVYHNQNSFSTAQLNHVFKKEKEFLKSASSVFFSSKWALEDAKKSYNIGGENFYVAGLGGGFNLVRQDYEKAKPYFLFIGLDFFGKGGDIVVNAFNKMEADFPDFTLKIVGQKPPDEFLKSERVEYLGMINKSEEEDLNKMIALYSNAYCFLLPTAKDMTPLVLIEAGSVGCPVITMANFGISEMIKDGETGFLLNPKYPIEEQLEKSMRLICNDQTLRRTMSLNIYKHVKDNYTWGKTGEIIYNTIVSKINLQ